MERGHISPADGLGVEICPAFDAKAIGTLLSHEYINKELSPFS